MATDAGQQGYLRIYSQIVAKAWVDPAFRQRLLADPRAVFEEAGLTLPQDAEVRVVENTSNVIHLPLPAKPAEISDEQLQQVAGGTSTVGSAATVGCVGTVCGTASSIGSSGTAGTAPA